jgi:hypothetical protein
MLNEADGVEGVVGERIIIHGSSTYAFNFCSLLFVVTRVYQIFSAVVFYYPSLKLNQVNYIASLKNHRLITLYPVTSNTFKMVLLNLLKYFSTDEFSFDFWQLECSGAITTL